MGFARLYSGRLSRGKKVYIIGPKATGKDGSGSIFPFTVERLYMMMGPNQEGLKDVYAGNVFSIGGLDELVFKSASISSYECCPSLTPLDVN
jgi:ribosome assembly protein 1